MERIPYQSKPLTGCTTKIKFGTGVILEGKKQFQHVLPYINRIIRKTGSLFALEKEGNDNRRMCEMVGLKVLRLIRTAVGPVN